ncbi:transporter substrate-binding domain-containing protein [Aliiglaciecola sp. CAU 1673]|uniref:substrate-binding periplasmic protein n=1 Tax=Aliiglaciecola sp. CAU 1673 TaxID=3032595 RepID=UPI0023D9A78D|nr:transporter substrate-binding domain-containing protein [Aliiglaciecola sp. CAU 1673]MDF2176720.1 transporter substrate-binding domain-containing protein [Aliiglaciecola sp. CAU 1673]
MFRVLLICLFLTSGYAGADSTSLQESMTPLPKLTILTEDYGPFNYLDTGELKGFSSELVRMILTDLGSDISQHDMQVMPWARAYQIALVRPNTLIYTITHTEQRDMLFRWVGPLLSTRVVIVAKKDKGLRGKSFEELQQHPVGAIRDDVGEQLLVEQGFPLERIVSNSNPLYMVEMLNKDRIDALAHGEIASNWYLLKSGQSLDDFEVVYTLKESHQYLAFNRNTSKALVDLVQEAFMRIKLSPRYEALMAKYPAISHRFSSSRQRSAAEAIAVQR